MRGRGANLGRSVHVHGRWARRRGALLRPVDMGGTPYMGRYTCCATKALLELEHCMAKARLAPL